MKFLKKRPHFNAKYDRFQLIYGHRRMIADSICRVIIKIPEKPTALLRYAEELNATVKR